MPTTTGSSTTRTNTTRTPTVRGQTFAQASAGITDRTKLGAIAQSFQAAAANSNSSSNSGSNSSSNSNSGSNINRYDPNTGKLLSPGQTVVNQYTGQTIKEGTQFIGATDLNRQAPSIPTTPMGTIADAGKYNGIVSSVVPQVTGNMAIDTSLSNQKTDFEKMLSSLQAPASQAEIYAQAQKETGILQKQQTVNDYSAQLNTIQAQAQANQLALVGQGRGIPEGIIGGQQAQIAREAAIAALPVSAQLQAAQGNLQMAQENLNTLFKIRSEDAAAQYQYKNNLVRSVYEFASGQEKIKLDYAMKMEDRKYEEEQRTTDRLQNVSMELLKNQAPASIIKRATSARSINELMNIPGIGNYMQSPLEKLQLAKMGLDIKSTRLAMQGLIDESPTPGLTEKQRQKLLSDPTVKQTSANIGVLKLLEDYKKQVEAAGRAPSIQERKKLNSYLINVIGPAQAVANGQGALSKDETENLVNQLGVKGLRKRESVTLQNIIGSIAGTKSKINTGIDTVNSSFPGAGQSFELFNTYQTMQYDPLGVGGMSAQNNPLGLDL